MKFLLLLSAAAVAFAGIHDPRSLDHARRTAGGSSAPSQKSGSKRWNVEPTWKSDQEQIEDFYRTEDPYGRIWVGDKKVFPRGFPCPGGWSKQLPNGQCPPPLPPVLWPPPGTPNGPPQPPPSPPANGPGTPVAAQPMPSVHDIVTYLNRTFPNQGPTGERHNVLFWTGLDGRNVNAAQARRFAIRERRHTLQQLIGNRYSQWTRIPRGGNYAQVRPMWERLSEALAEWSQGTVWVIGSRAAFRRVDSVWAAIERPKLEERGIVIKEYDESGTPIHDELKRGPKGASLTAGEVVSQAIANTPKTAGEVISQAIGKAPKPVINLKSSTIGKTPKPITARAASTGPRAYRRHLVAMSVLKRQAALESGEMVLQAREGMRYGTAPVYAW